MKSGIHIVANEPEAFNESYVVAKMAIHWKAWGHDVTIGRVSASITGCGIMHIDQTRIDPEDLPETELPLLNRKVLDISKNRFSALRVYPDAICDGPVIIKSVLNYFGAPERKLVRPSYFEKKRRELSRVSWRLARLLPLRDYPVLRSAKAVPGWVWKRKDLIVERFLPERDGELYSIRGWLFFGDRGYAYRLYSKSPVVKVSTITHHEILEQVPPELELLRKEHGFDFGKFDYVEVDGKAVVIDMNKTPTTIANPDSPRMLDLAKGLYSFEGIV